MGPRDFGGMPSEYVREAQVMPIGISVLLFLL